jgi:heme/copper-type cytochrome/quinol oxidase subunit 2
MEKLFPLLTHLGAIFAFLMVYYFVPVIIYYYIFFIRYREKWKHLKIQQKYPTGSTNKTGSILLPDVAGNFFVCRFVYLRNSG